MKNNWPSILFYTFIIPFIIAMLIIGSKAIIFSHEIYEKSVTLSLATKTNNLCLDCAKNGYSEAFTYFVLALLAILVIILLPNLQSISFGGASITLRALKNEVNDLKTLSNDIQEKSVNTGPRTLPDESDMAVASPTARTNYPDDPQKGKWGGSADVNGRHLRAFVTESDIPQFYKVRLTVTGDFDNPLKGLVKFHLHDTFRNSEPIISAKNNLAELKLNWVYGAFTVGVETDNGQTKLELDLSELEDAPKGFRER